MNISLINKIKWEIKDKVAFKSLDQNNNEEIYLLAVREKEKGRINVGVVRVYFPFISGIYSIKDILIGLGFRRVAKVGISNQDYSKKRVMCPHCKTIQELKEEWQQCSNCNKNFYLFDDNC